MLVLPINGCAECGKDSFVEFVNKNIDQTLFEVWNISTIDPVKNAMRELGWDGTKTEENRLMMVEMKQLWIKRMNGPFNYVKDIIKETEERYQRTLIKLFFFIHVREPEEIQKLVDYYKKECQTILIKSDRGKALKNGADDVVENYNYDHVIYNNGTLDDLKNEAIIFTKEHLIRE
jgi:hypothetical protein